MEHKDPKKEDPNSNRFLDLSFYRAYAIYGGMVFQLVAIIVLGVLGGRFLDEKLATEPAFLIVGLLLGSVVGFYNFFRILTYYQIKQEKDEE